MTAIRFADRLKQLREAAGLTQPELADRASMNRFGVAKLEQGVREPSWATVQALARALGVSVLAFTDEATADESGPIHSGKQPTAAPHKGRPQQNLAATRAKSSSRKDRVSKTK